MRQIGLHVNSLARESHGGIDPSHATCPARTSSLKHSWQSGNQGIVKILAAQESRTQDASFSPPPPWDICAIPTARGWLHEIKRVHRRETRAAGQYVNVVAGHQHNFAGAHLDLCGRLQS